MQVGVTSRNPNPLLEERVMRAVEGELRAKGYRKVDVPGSADFVLSFTVGARENIKIDSYPTMGAAYRSPAHWGWGAGYYGHGTETRVRQTTTGMLAIDVFDVKELRPVWHGVASKTISEADRKEAEATVQAAVTAILAGFPPQ